VRAGKIFDGAALETSTEAVTLALARRGYPFAQTHARLSRDPAMLRVGVTFAVEEGPRTYVERIDIHGNTKTQDSVIRRELDLAEGDPYNKVLLDRAERHLKNLSYFKSIKITSRPGSTPDRILVDVAVEEQQTGEFSIAGGYSTTYGLIAQVNVGERNFMGTGQYLKASVTVGQYTNGFDISATQPYFLGTRLSAGIEIFSNQALANTYQSFNSETYGATLRIGMPLDDQLSLQWRYSIYNQSVSLDPSMGISSLPIQQAALAGPAWVSAVGDTVTYSTLDNNRSPTSGLIFELKQDLAGLGGDVNFLRTTADLRYYQPVTDDIVGLVRAQSGYVTGWGGQQVPLMDTFFGGPQLVRGFAPNGFGPRDLTPGTTMDNVGGSIYWATTAELQSRIPGVPQDFGLKLATFADAGSVWGYNGPTAFPGSAQSFQLASSNVLRSSVGVGLVWDSPFGGLRINYAVPVSKAAYDVTEPFQFSAGPF
jgi:outer membrane protein insertion porin family